MCEQDFWVGADPGGARNFGLCLLGSDLTAKTWCVDCADEAVALVVAHSTRPPLGVGIDAPMWWSSGPGGGRLADSWIRKTYGLSPGQVQAVNSLQGAALAQGMLFVERLREHFPTVRVTESHPNAVLRALSVEWPEFCDQFGLEMETDTKHERDAMIAAISAREGFEGRWARDLSLARYPSEQDPTRYWLAPMQYFWPGQ